MDGVQMAGDETERLEILPNPFKVIYLHLKFFLAMLLFNWFR